VGVPLPPGLRRLPRRPIADAAARSSDHSLAPSEPRSNSQDPSSSILSPILMRGGMNFGRTLQRLKDTAEKGHKC
jgi:hypothetical protein